MDHPEAHELGRFEARDHPEHARLFAPLQLRLKPDEAVVIGGEVVLPQLDDGVRPSAGARIGQPGRLHRPEPQRVDAAVRHHLDRQTPLEELRVVEVVDGRLLGRHDRLVKRAGTRRGRTDSSGSRLRRRLRRPDRRRLAPGPHRASFGSSARLGRPSRDRSFRRGRWD